MDILSDTYSQVTIVPGESSLLSLKVHLPAEVERRSANPALAVKVEASLAIIDRAFDTFTEEGLAISFNGGKDSTLLVYLVLYAYIRRTRKEKDYCLRGIYFHFPTCFPEETRFVTETSTRLRMRLITTTKPYREGLQDILTTEQPLIRAIFMGTRYTDPSCAQLEEFTPNTPGWPSFVRVNPILDWSYSDVWTFILTMDIPYCSLYDDGYTSIGEINNTKPNPALLHDGVYAPAYTLIDGEQERAGRLSRSARTL